MGFQAAPLGGLVMAPPPVPKAVPKAGGLLAQVMATHNGINPGPGPAYLRMRLNSRADDRRPTCDCYVRLSLALMEDIGQVAELWPAHDPLLRSAEQIKILPGGLQIRHDSFVIKVWLQKGEVHVTGRSPQLGLQYMSSWTSP